MTKYEKIAATHMKIDLHNKKIAKLEEELESLYLELDQLEEQDE